MADPLSETVEIDGRDAAVLARNVKTYAADIKAAQTGASATTLTNGFPGFQIGQAYATATTTASKALQDLGKTLDALGDNTVTVAAKFLHIDEARAREFDRLDPNGPK
ncbi:hypothetical protein NDR87_24700 [Nocardia sp. CDC159]|uniref:Excreted virulence factor EspC (Type VII ESX diderm) n=1 Tax=Nocardia pulmonis TaxID=2951408 RepID=A0A9X2IX86_9NOCA|nr:MULTISPECIES: hypothetical protein [Nocardia]MCM6775103.1 hypothetical protein [Nocardia pulmonis]MCM6789573.1 hypothetical protein [Nocardia sp. CDC159]